MMTLGNYKIKYLASVTEEDIPNLPKTAAIIERLVVDPIGFGKPLRYSLKGHRRLRVNDYRIVNRIEPETSTVLIIAIKHRKDVYD
jgi:mRNA interferase RelE/StbE